RGSTRTACWPVMDFINAMRLMPSTCAMAARDRFTSEAICWAASTARGSNSSWRRVCTQASTPTASKAGRRKNVRQKRLSDSSLRDIDASGRLAGNEHVADAPDGLDVARVGWVGFDHLAQARDLHV